MEDKVMLWRGCMDGRWSWGDCVKVMGRLREVVVGRLWEGYGEVVGKWLCGVSGPVTSSSFQRLLRCSREWALSMDKWTSEMASS